MPTIRFHILKPIFRILAFFMVAVLLPQAAVGQTMAPYGSNAREYSFETGQFTTLKITDNVNVVYRCVPDTTAKVVYHADPDFEDAFIFTNSNGNLRVQVNTDDVGKPGLPTIYVYSDYLAKVENYSDFRVKVENPAPCPEFSATIVGNGSISVEGIKATKVAAKIVAGMGSIALEGECGDASFKITGTGTIQADRLEAAKAYCRILGGGSIGVNAKDFLKVSGLGSTKVYYLGNPVIKHSGGGKLIKAD